MRVTLVTAGDIGRRTGGYLYHARVAQDLAHEGVLLEQIIASRDASADGQRRAAQDAAAIDSQVLAADVIVVDALAALVVASRLDVWQSRRPLVAMVHELPSVAAERGEADLLAAEERLLRADRVIAVSQHGRGILLDRGVAPERVAVVAPGADRLRRSDHWKQTGDGNLRVLCVAQWIPRKGIDTLVRAWLALGRNDATLDLVGETDVDPQYAAQVRALAASTPPGSVVIHGSVDDVALAAAWQRAALFALPTRYEGYGMVFAEALLHGLPVVAGAVGPVPELVGPNAGLLVPPDDPAALTLALARLLDDGELRASMAAAARARGEALPTWADTACAFQSVLDAAMRERAG